MRPNNAVKWGLAAVVVSWCLATALFAAFGSVEGRIAINLPDGTTAHGDWIRVLLVTESVDTEAISRDVDAQIAQVGGGRQGVRTNRLHLEFYKQVMARMTANPRYVAASTLTTEDGTFKFAGVAPGDYWVVITFPSIIQNYKVAWQVPVRMTADGGAFLPLTEGNLLFPLEPPR